MVKFSHSTQFGYDFVLLVHFLGHPVYVGFLYLKSIFCSGKPPGYDRVRNAEIGNKDFELDVLEEAYTSEHWIVRIYKVIFDCFRQ